MAKLFFKPAARLQRFLGRELIGDPNLALAEFVKNAYDAGASRVVLDFLVADQPRSDQVIRIADDGIGMNLEEFKTNWMRPGFSEKEAQRRRARRTGVATTARQRSAARMPIGEKGIGRLAAGRLGDVLHVFTRRNPSDRWLHVYFNWNDFQDMNIPLDRVPISYDYTTQPEAPLNETGTLLVVEQLTLNWAGNVPGRRSVGRVSSRLGRLRQDLELLISPLGGSSSDFVIELQSDYLPEHQAFVGEASPVDVEHIDYRYDFELSWDDRRGLRVHRTVRRSQDLAEEIGAKVRDTDTAWFGVGFQPRADDAVSHVGRLTAGPIKGTFFYIARQGIARRLPEMGVQPGVFLYRDGVRVEPYGNPDEDWVGVQARKASRQGYAALRPNDLYGYVSISAETNPELRDMSNRIGLLENDEYEEFLSHVRAEFRAFDDLVLREYIKPHWAETAEIVSQRVAERTVSDREVLIRDVVHDLRQPIAALSSEFRTIELVVESLDLPDDDRRRLGRALRRGRLHLRDLSRIASQFLNEDVKLDLEPTSLREVVEAAVENVAPYAETENVDVRVRVSDRKVVVVPTYLERALSNLLRNAIAAVGPDGETERWVEVRSEVKPRLALVVQDNGAGVDLATAARLFRQPVSRRGRQGVGLINVRDLLRSFGADVALTNPGEAGATFRITLSSVGELRRETRR
jgi:signal transduction histidine kinase